MASSSSAISQSWNHDVFMSFRGEDTRSNFVDHLYAALVQQGIQTYKDDETLDRGERIAPALLKAIQESRIAVIIFSKNYADSSWCLDELAHIIECMDTRGQIVEPVFYHVDPSDVRKQKGKYGEAFLKHETENKHKVESWRKALEKAGNLSGWVINDTENSREAKCIKEIVGTISNRLPPLNTNINKDLIGIETRLKDLKSKLKIGPDGVRVVGIWGVGGGGKTTLASAAYMEISHRFEVCCLLENIREESSKHGLKKLQEILLSRILKTDVVVGSEIEGRSMIDQRLCGKHVLLVLDDVDDVKQLEVLVGSRALFGDGSRIIITTRDQHLLSRHADELYEVRLLSRDEAIELFNKHAYREDKPIEDYKKLSKDVVSYAGGLPLALEVLGSLLYDKNEDEWKSALAKLKCIPNVKVTERLKLSYDALEPDQQELFLDIACFWRSKNIDEAMMVLDACTSYPRIGIKVLVQKSLIKVSDGRFDMHDLIEEMAHYIVRGKHPKNPEKHSRIWKKKDLVYLCNMGADALQMETEVLVSDESMRSISEYPNLYDVVTNMKKLRWIKVTFYEASSIPSGFHPIELGCLDLSFSKGLKELWHGHKHLPNLKILNLSSSENLIRTPDFDGLPCLERLILYRCVRLEKVHPSIGYHKRLVYVNLTLCTRLKRFPPIIEMKKLETLLLINCQQLQDFPDIRSNMDSLVTLDLRSTKIENIPPSVGQFCTNLESLDVYGCNELKRIDGNFHLLKNLKELHISRCFGIQPFHLDTHFPRRFLRKLKLSCCNLGDGDIPSDICDQFVNLQALDLSQNEFSHLPSSISRLPCLKYLNLSECKNLVELPDLPSSIAVLNAQRCYSLESVGDISDYKSLWKASFRSCIKLVGYERVLRSMLKVNFVEDRFMSLFNPPIRRLSSVHRNFVTLQLPDNWYGVFSGFLISLHDPKLYGKAKLITIRLEMRNKGDRNVELVSSKSKIDDLNKYSIWEEEEEVADIIETYGQPFEKQELWCWERWAYIPFSSLRHIPWLNPAYSQNISFQARKGYLNVKLVRIESKIGDLNERPVNYSECWDEENEDRKTFRIIYDSNSNELGIVWYTRVRDWVI